MLGSRSNNGPDLEANFTGTPPSGVSNKQRSNLHITNDVRCSASGGRSLTREAEIENESSLSAPAREIPLSPIHR